MKTRTRVTAAAALGGLGILGLMAAACGSKGAPLAGGGDDTSSDGGGGVDDASAEDAGGGATSDATGFFQGGGDGSTTQALDCKPGTYKGTFTTSVTNDAGGLFSLFTFKWTGTLSIALQQETTMDNSGEIPTTTLAIAPGAQVIGTDDNGGHFSADLSGQLDCPSRALTGSLTNGLYAFFGDAGIAMTGALTGSYDSTATPPTLNGSITAMSPQVPQTAAVGAWKATLE